ncbi:MAG: fibronectin type III-like domain-contianing protein [Peptostreptococcaceae bacterium]
MQIINTVVTVKNGTVIFEINEEMLRFIGKDMKYILEPGKFEVFVGKNSEETLKDFFVLNK